jgi:TIR domain
MAYKYDLFISYKRMKFDNEWIAQHFLPLLSHRLSQTFGAHGLQKPTVFIDVAEKDARIRQNSPDIDFVGVATGSDWEKELEKAISVSACMLGLWSPLYFKAEWCLIEFKSFEFRQTSTFKPVLPVSIFDGENFPAEVRTYQIAQMAEYCRAGPIKDLPFYTNFDSDIAALSKEIAVARKSAPRFKDWPIVKNFAQPTFKHSPFPSF